MHRQQGRQTGREQSRGAVPSEQQQTKQVDRVDARGADEHGPAPHEQEREVVGLWQTHDGRERAADEECGDATQVVQRRLVGLVEPIRVVEDREGPLLGKELDVAEVRTLVGW